MLRGGSRQRQRHSVCGEEESTRTELDRVWWEMIHNRVLSEGKLLRRLSKEMKRHAYLDDLEKFFRPIYTSNRKLVKQLHWKEWINTRNTRARGTETRTHETTEPLERSWDTNVRVDLNKNASRSVDIHLQQPSLVQRRVKESEEALENFF